MSWPTKTLGDVASWGSGGTPKRSEAQHFGEGVPWLSIADLNDGVVTQAKESLTASGIQNSSAKVVPAGTILVAMYGSIGKLGIAGMDLCTSQAIAFARPDPEIVDTRYLFHFLLAERPQLQGRGRGGTQMNISQGDLKAWPIPLPPLDEQCRIAAILDQADALRTKRRKALAHLDDLIPAVFIAMFGVEARAAVSPRPRPSSAQGWDWVLLSDVAEMATGHTPDRKKPEYWDGSIPWVSLPEIRRLDGFTALDTDLTITSAGVANSSAVVLPAGTVCFSRTASIGFVTKLGRPMATSQDFHNWIPGKCVNADYLMTALRVSRSHLLGASDGSTHKTIYQRTASTFRLLLPPIELQNKFSDIFRSLSTQRAALQLASHAQDELFVGLQFKAFRGDL